MDDRQIIGLFFERSEQAIDTVNDKYGKLCRRLAGNMLSTLQDAEECVSDAYLALWNTIPPEQPKSLRAYLTRILRNIAYDHRDKQTAARRDDRLQVSLEELAGCLPDHASENCLDSLVIRDALNRFLQAQSKENRYLFLRRYYYLDSCRQIAKAAGMPESTVSTRLARMRQELRELLLEEGIYV